MANLLAKKTISDEEKDLFREAIRGTRPLQDEPRIKPLKRKPSPRPRQRERDEQQVLEDMFSDPAHPEDMENGEELMFRRSGLQDKVMRKLRRGEFSVEAELDLHGLVKLEARQLISDFFRENRRLGYRCIRIIHGKGEGSAGKRPILKQYVNHWLPQCDDVLAFCSARQVDGGTGAIYVLLRAPK